MGHENAHIALYKTGSYNKLKTPRHERLYIFCLKCIGDDYHVLMECEHDILKDIPGYYTSLLE